MPGDAMNDTDRIAHGISQAAANAREISDTTARIIAAQWHGGQSSELYAFVSTGAITPELRPEYWNAELLQTYQSATLDEREHLDWLGNYFLRLSPRPPVAGWAEKTRY